MLSLQRGDIGTQIQTWIVGRQYKDTKRTQCEDRGRDWNDAAINQGTWRIDGRHQKLGRGNEEFSLMASEGVDPCQNLDFGLLASRTLRQHISVILSHPVFGLYYGSLRKLIQKPKQKCS